MFMNTDSVIIPSIKSIIITMPFWLGLGAILLIFTFWKYKADIAYQYLSNTDEMFARHWECFE